MIGLYTSWEVLTPLLGIHMPSRTARYFSLLHVVILYFLNIGQTKCELNIIIESHKFIDRYIHTISWDSDTIHWPQYNQESSRILDPWPFYFAWTSARLGVSSALSSCLVAGCLWTPWPWPWPAPRCTPPRGSTSQSLALPRSAKTWRLFVSTWYYRVTTSHRLNACCMYIHLTACLSMSRWFTEACWRYSLKKWSIIFNSNKKY